MQSFPLLECLGGKFSLGKCKEERMSHTIETQLAPEYVCPEVRLTWLHNLQFSKSKGSYQNLIFLLSLPSIFLPCASSFLCLEFAKVFCPTTLTADTGPDLEGGIVVAVFILGFFVGGGGYNCFMGNRWGNSGNSVRLYFLGLQNHCRW